MLWEVCNVVKICVCMRLLSWTIRELNQRSVFDDVVINEGFQ